MLEWLREDPLSFLVFMLYRAPAVLMALSFHEAAHGYAAYRSGDSTAKRMGRLSLNPFSHLDLWGTVSMFLIGVGWAKPVPVNPYHFRRRRRDELFVSLAGVSVNLVLFLLTTLVTVFMGQALYTREAARLYGMEFFLGFGKTGFFMQLYPEYARTISQLLSKPWLLHVQRFLFQFALVNLGLGLFNLLPFPPLDGFHALNNIVFRGNLALSGQAFRVAQIVLIVLLISTDFIGRWISGAIYGVQGFVLRGILSILGL